MVTTAFGKHTTYRNVNYLGLGYTQITATASSAERMSLFSNPDFPGLQPAVIVIDNTTNTGSLFDSTNYTITTADGRLWQYCMKGYRLFMVQTTRALNGATYTGEGYFEEPGSSKGGWESTSVNDAFADKDAIHAIQHVRHYALRYGVDPGAIHIDGSSAGSIAHNMTSFGQNWAMQFGTGGQFNRPTRPNSVYCGAATGVSARVFTQNAPFSGATKFESVATPGTPAAQFDDVDPFSLRAREIPGYCPFWSTRRAPPTFCWSDTQNVSFDFGEPYPAATEGTSAHSAWTIFALKAQFPNVYATVKATYIDTDAEAEKYVGLYEAVLEDPDAAGVAGNTSGVLIDWVDAHIREPARIRDKGEVWIYNAKAMTTGRFCIPPPEDGKRRLLRIWNTSTANDLAFGPSQDTARVTVTPGNVKELVTSGAVWIKSAAATPAFYMVEEGDA